jgi:hypothetical protein
MTYVAIYLVGMMKGEERYIVSCDKANAGKAYFQLCRWAEDASLSFDWDDAVKLCRQLSEEING